jgi:hypothetical protein
MTAVNRVRMARASCPRLGSAAIHRRFPTWHSKGPLAMLLALVLAVPVVGFGGEPADNAAAPRPITDARDMLDRCGVDVSQLNRLIDSRPIVDDETEPLVRVLYTLRKFDLTDLEKRWTRKDLDLNELVKQSDFLRGQAFTIEGQVSVIKPVDPLPEVVERFEMKRYYRCEFVLKDDQQPAILFVETVPKAWRKGGQIDARAGACGLFMKLASKDEKRPVPVFVARRIAWYPPTPLGDLGFDAGMLDTVENKGGLTEQDREPFYQMLAAAGRAQPRQLIKEADQELKELCTQAEETTDAAAKKRLKKLIRTDREGDEFFSVAPLFNEPDEQHGRLVVLSGVARRVEEIRVDDPDIRARFGIDHYYQISLFPDDSQGNPVMFCVRTLPEGMPPSDVAGYGESIRVAGFFFKKWTYKVVVLRGERPEDAEGGVGRHPAPLLIGNDLIWYPEQKPAKSLWRDVMAGGLFVVVALLTWFALFRGGGGGKRRRPADEKVTVNVPENQP